LGRIQFQGAFPWVGTTPIVTVAAGDGFTTLPAEIVVTVEDREDESGLAFELIVAG